MNILADRGTPANLIPGARCSSIDDDDHERTSSLPHGDLGRARSAFREERREERETDRRANGRRISNHHQKNLPGTTTRQTHTTLIDEPRDTGRRDDRPRSRRRTNYGRHHAAFRRRARPRRHLASSRPVPASGARGKEGNEEVEKGQVEEEEERGEERRRDSTGLGGGELRTFIPTRIHTWSFAISKSLARSFFLSAVRGISN